MRANFFIALRYLYSKRGFLISFNSLITMLGLVIGVCALIIVISVMSGFSSLLRDKIIGVNAHIVVESQMGVRDFNAVQNKLRVTPEVVHTAAYVTGSAFLFEDNKALPVIIKGILPDDEILTNDISRFLYTGRLDIVPGEVLIGIDLANQLDIRVGDNIQLQSPASSWYPPLYVAGIVNTGMYDYDNRLVVLHLEEAQLFFNLARNLVSGIGIKVRNPSEVDIVKYKIQTLLPANLIAKTWMELNKALFAALKLEKWTMFTILSLIILVASFNLIATLSILVSDKIKDIGILKAIGFSPSDVKNIFTYVGLCIGVVGIALGAFLGCLVAYCLDKYHFIRIPAEAYTIDYLPALLQFRDVLYVIVVAFFITLIATVFPAMRAARLNPVEALRYE